MMEDLLVYWVNEREKIRKLKQSGAPQPWTEDPIFQMYRFCNVRRKDDKVSQWIKWAAYDRFAFHPEVFYSDGFIQLAALCRFINWPPTIAEVMNRKGWTPETGYNGKEITKIIVERKDRGDKIFSNAYMVRGSLTKGTSKIPYIVEMTCGQNVRRRLPLIRKALETRSRQKVTEALSTIKGWGSFMSGQVTDDLTWCHLLHDPVDNYTWAPQGPGSRRGYNRLTGRDLYASIGASAWQTMLQSWRELIIDRVDPVGLWDLTLHDVQNCLCEFDKYVRVKEGGRMKNKYKPKPEGEW